MLKKKLDRNIWITRKCRINASDRLLKDAKYIEFLNVYYSIFVITLSLLSFVMQDSQYSFASIVCSIALTISIIYANATGLRERSEKLKQNYIDLQILLDQLSLIDDKEEERILAINEKYAELLKSTENHLEIDYLRLRRTKASDVPPMGYSENFRWYRYLIIGFLGKAILILAPIIGGIYLFVLR